MQERVGLLRKILLRCVIAEWIYNEGYRVFQDRETDTLVTVLVIPTCLGNNKNFEKASSIQ